MDQAILRSKALGDCLGIRHQNMERETVSPHGFLYIPVMSRNSKISLLDDGRVFKRRKRDADQAPELRDGKRKL